MTRQGWKAVRVPEPCGWSLAGVWRWVLVLWGVVIVSFFKAFGGPQI